MDHSSDSNEHYTPPEIVEAARSVMGAIDLDPASCAEANKVVEAREFFECGGLDRAWYWTPPPMRAINPARVFLNPPGGYVSRHTLEPASAGASSAGVWWEKLLSEYDDGNVAQAIFVCFNLALFRVGQGGLSGAVRAPYSFPFCVPRKRLRFWTSAGPGAHPKYDNAIIYLPPREGGADGAARFLEAFSPFGEVRL